MRRLAGMLLVAVLVMAAPEAPAKVPIDQRAAQGNCTREIERRGFQVVGISNFKQGKDGWQLDVSAHDSRGRTVGGTCFVETRSGDVHLYGLGWGSSGSDSSPGPGPGTGTGTGQYVECRSQNERYRECAIARGYQGRLVRDYTGRCRKDSTWGNRAGLVWVTSGCHARFQLVPVRGDGRDDDERDDDDRDDDDRDEHEKDNRGQRQRAEVQCRNEAIRQGIEVRYVAPATLRGSYWSTTVQGRLRGRAVQAACRFHPAKNRAELVL